LYIFQENPRELTLYVCIRGVQQKCVNMYYMMHMARGSQKIKAGETYALSAKTRQSVLGNWIIRFCQQSHKNRNIRFIKLDSPVFPDTTYKQSNIHHAFQAFKRHIKA
jgi:hypothetical protein